MYEQKESNRRNFFSLLSKGFVGLAFISIVPKVFRKIENKELVNIKIHPSAIKQETK